MAFVSKERHREYHREYMRQWRKDHPRTPEQNEAHNAYMREWEANNKPRVLSRRKELYGMKSQEDRYAPRKKRYEALKLLLAEIKMSSGCVDCGYKDHPHALHFDHLPGFEKRFGVAIGATTMSKEAVLAEVKKCAVRCANCHAIKTALRRKGVH